MALAVRHVVVVLLALAQVALGPSAGGVVCFGGGAAESGAASACSHAGEDDGLHLPASVAPHQERDDDCPCIDVGTPTGRTDDGRTGADLMRDSAVLVRLPAPYDGESGRPAVSHAHRAQRPPGPEPGLRTTRLLI